MLNITEEWKPVKDFLNYEVSNLGRIRTKKGLIRKYYIQNSGYCGIDMHQAGKRKKMLVHRVVALNWIPNLDPEHKTQINHKDGNKENNSVDNLEWVTCSENVKHARDTGLNTFYNGSIGKKMTGKKTSKSRFHGVYWDGTRKKWIGTVTHNHKNIKPKRFNTEEEAALHYNNVLISLGLDKERPLNVIKCPTTSLNDVNSSELKR